MWYLKIIVQMSCAGDAYRFDSTVHRILSEDGKKTKLNTPINISENAHHINNEFGLSSYM